MEAVGNPKTWVPYMNTKDCSKGFCSHVDFPPPPSMGLLQNGTRLSLLVITIISVVASGLLLVTYFAIISKCCRKKSSDRRQNHDLELQDGNISSFHQLVNYATVGGLDEGFIKSIAVCKFKKEDGLVQGMDCSVCLGEFQENECLRILPKCSHSFHVQCIDMWLKSHSTCPLCRTSLTCTSTVSQLHLSGANQPSSPEIHSA
ncbi:unnamed protein product [Rhodiola kirilowii]